MMNSRKELLHLSDVMVLVTKMDSTWVPFDVEVVEFSPTENDPLGMSKDEIWLTETGGIPLPEGFPEMAEGDVCLFSAKFYGRYFTISTQNGNEHEAEFEYRDVVYLAVPTKAAMLNHKFSLESLNGRRGLVDIGAIKQLLLTGLSVAKSVFFFEKGFTDVDGGFWQRPHYVQHTEAPRGKGEKRRNKQNRWH